MSSENMERACDREAEAAYRDYNEGWIGNDELNRRLADIQRDYRDAAQDAAHEAYERESEQW